jgi:hypothetical protein
MSARADDVLGLSVEAVAGQGDEGKSASTRFCRAMSDALLTEIEAEGFAGDIQQKTLELWRREQAVLSGKRACPLQDTCERRRRALERGGRPLYPVHAPAQPVQLRLDFERGKRRKGKS